MLTSNALYFYIMLLISSLIKFNIFRNPKYIISDHQFVNVLSLNLKTVPNQSLSKPRKLDLSTKKNLK